MVKKAGSEKWGGPVPSSCDWRKATNIISSIKNQVSAQSALGEGGDEVQALIPYPAPPSSHSGILQVLLGHGSSGQHRGPVAHQTRPACGSLCAGYGREMGDRERWPRGLLT